MDNLKKKWNVQKSKVQIVSPKNILKKSDLEHNAAIPGNSWKVAYHKIFVNICKKGFKDKIIINI